MISFGCNRVLQALPRLCSFMNKRPDSIYFSSLEHVSIIGMIAAKLTNRQIIIRIPNMPRNVLASGIYGLKNRMIKALNHWLLRSVRMIIAQNAEMREQILKYYHLPAEKVVAINNPVDKDYVLASAKDSKNPFASDEVSFLSACTVDYRKGIDVLMQAWPMVKAAIPNAHMYVAGRNTSDYAKGLTQRAVDLSDFTFLGFQNNPYPLMKYCDVFVLPSRMEGFPNVVLESMCFDKPVAATTCVEVIKDIITPGENGYYCDIEDADALANCMIKANSLKKIHNEYSLFDKETLLSLFK